MLFYKIPTLSLPRVMLMSHTELQKSIPHKTRTVSETVIYYLTEGCLELESAGEQITLTAGDIHIFSRGEFQKPIKACECKYYYLHLFDSLEHEELTGIQATDYFANSKKYFLKTNLYEKDISENTFPYLLIPKHFNIRGSAYSKKISSVFSSSELNSLTAKDEHYNLFYNMNAMLIFYRIHNAYSDYILNRSSGFNENTVSRIMEYITSHMSEHISGASIEKEFGYSFDYINRSFKQITGETVFGYLTRARINQAKLMLYADNASVTKTAELTGFCDIYITFLRHLRSTPAFPPPNT